MIKEIKELKKEYKNKDCLIITAGPSLKNVSKSTLTKLAKGKVIIAVKQAIHVYPEIVDIHVINDNNYEVYNYSKCKKSIKVIALKSPAILSFMPGANSFTEFRIDRKTCKWEDCLAQRNNFADYEIKVNSNRRPWGPGIMYELCIYFPVLFNSRNVIFVAWDLGYKNSSIIERFYENKRIIESVRSFIYKISPLIYNKLFIKLENIIRIILYLCGIRVLLGIPGITKNEAIKIADSSYYLSEYYKKKNISHFILSDESMLHPNFKRI